MNQLPFKMFWEKDTQSAGLSPAEILAIAQLRFPKVKAEQLQVLANGCVNQNIKIHLGNAPSEVLRIYLRDPSASFREANISKRLKDTVPLPKIHAVGAKHGHHFVFMDYIQGIPLGAFLTKKADIPLASIMYEAGEILANIASVSFDQSGFFDKDLLVTKPSSPGELQAFANELLSSEYFEALLSKKVCQALCLTIDRHKSLLNNLDETHLVHGDFDPANILVHQDRDQWKITGILDWEFAFSGSTCWDIANMLRYAHQMPSEFTDCFLEGLQTSYQLPDEWRIRTHLYNIISLLDCLQRTDVPNSPIRTKDIQQLIVHHLETIDSKIN